MRGRAQCKFMKGFERRNLPSPSFFGRPSEHEGVVKGSVEQNVMFPREAFRPGEPAGSFSLVGLKRGSVPHNAIIHEELHREQRQPSPQVARAAVVSART